MDNKKLLQILLRDAGELEQLIGEIRQAGSFDPLDMELLQTRISGIKHLLEVASDIKEAQPKTSETLEKSVPMAVSPPEVKSGSAPGIQPEVPRKNKEKKKEPDVMVTANRTVPVPKATFTGPTLLEAMIPKEPEAPDHEITPAEENVYLHEKIILAEKFVAGKSLNDILQEKSKTEPKTEPKFTNLPLDSLATGIGTNERFLFTRELFDGNMDHFNDTILKLDTMNNIQEAIDFLSDNFKWGKSETTLRFIDLIKRRFIR